MRPDVVPDERDHDYFRDATLTQLRQIRAIIEQCPDSGTWHLAACLIPWVEGDSAYDKAGKKSGTDWLIHALTNYDMFH